MPAFEPSTNQVSVSYTEFRLEDLSHCGRLVFKICKTLKLNEVNELPDGIIQMSNFTLIAWVLYVCGPMKESHLTLRLLAIQVLCTVIAFFVRYGVAYMIYEKVE